MNFAIDFINNLIDFTNTNIIGSMNNIIDFINVVIHYTLIFLCFIPIYCCYSVINMIQYFQHIGLVQTLALTIVIAVIIFLPQILKAIKSNWRTIIDIAETIMFLLNAFGLTFFSIHAICFSINALAHITQAFIH